MNRLLLVPCCCLLLGSLKAQTVGDAEKLLYYERYDSAGHLLQYLTTADPNNAQAWWLLTQAELHQGQAAKIRERLRSLPAANLQAPFLNCAWAQLLLQDQQKDSATVYFSKALEQTRQKDPAVLLAIAEAQVESPAGDPVQALDLIAKAQKKDRRNPHSYVIAGNAYRRLQNGTESYKAYQDALAQDPKNAEASYKLGKLFVTQANPDMYVKYFTDAVTNDPLYAPAWYELYYYYYFRDVNKAMDCLQHYITASDPSPRNDYLMTDLLYASRKYPEAISHAQELIASGNGATEPRLYKLIAYSSKELNDSSKALHYMQQYFSKQTDSGFVTKDFETMGDIYEKLSGKQDSAARYYTLACSMEKDSTLRIPYYKKLCDIYKAEKNYPEQANWLGKYYQHNTRATNLDLFNWGLANYMAQDYKMADSVFGMYESKYPEQSFGYYWRARSNAAIDTAMQTGIAIPHYTKFIEMTEKDTANAVNRRHLIESYGYLAAYKANTEKNYAEAIAWFEKLLSLDPGNKDAQRYIDILKKNMGSNNMNRAGAQRRP